jgi:hypothetical protein
MTNDLLMPDAAGVTYRYQMDEPVIKMSRPERGLGSPGWGGGWWVGWGGVGNSTCARTGA